MTRDRSERRRKRLRLILLLGSLPLVIALFIGAVKFIGLSVTTGHAIELYDVGAYTQSEKKSTSLMGFNLVEKWIPYFNRGDAKVGDKDYTSAVDDFENALQLAPKEKQCAVRVNLARTWEALGDQYEAAGYHEGAVQLYQAAKDVIAAAGSECDPDSESGQQLQQTKDDVDEKQAQAQQNAELDGGQDGDGQSEQDKLDQLGQKQQQGEQDKSNQDAQQNGGVSGGSTTTKPW